MTTTVQEYRIRVNAGTSFPAIPGATHINNLALKLLRRKAGFRVWTRLRINFKNLCGAGGVNIAEKSNIMGISCTWT
jgi:hypothetical protein